MSIYLSIIVPIYNEEQNIVPLLNSLKNALEGMNYEIILVDDGSQDDSKKEILHNLDKDIILVELCHNYGQTSAIAAGIEAAQGEYIVMLDGDLQNDPTDIPLMLKKLTEEGYDLIAGIRAERAEKAFLRRFPSKCANFLIRRLSGVHIKDYGCTLKVFKAQLAKKLDLYGELHRFIPILAKMRGARIGQMEVKHHPRIFGQSKYGIGRTIKVFSDLLLMLFFQKYRQKPMHLFGNIAVLMGGIGFILESYLMMMKLLTGKPMSGSPLFYLGILLVIMSVQFITTGFLAELMMRTYYKSQNSKPYEIARIHRYDDV
jgi:dolichol-phosphate mannosyltransferase